MSVASDRGRNVVVAGVLGDECRRFTRYLVDASPSDYVIAKYVEAHRVSDRLGARTPFDRILLRAASIGSWGLRMADAYGRIFVPTSALRCKLIVMLAILETSAPSYRRVDDPGAGPPMAVIGHLVWRAAIAGAALVSGTLVLLPAHGALWLSGRARD